MEAAEPASAEAVGRATATSAGARSGSAGCASRVVTRGGAAKAAEMAAKCRSVVATTAARANCIRASCVIASTSL
eukprot:6448528-Prymnesium_polylepis.1